MATITKLSPGLWHISLPFQGEHDVIGAYVLAGKDEVALIDPGPATTIDALIASLEEIEINPQKVTHILLTHIHLDHAGGVGSLLHHMPDARVLVHSKGAPHIEDPAKLITSATRIYKDQMEELWGKIEPVPVEHIQILEGGDTLNIAGRRLEVHYTPGHASHHIVFFDVHSGELFAGDVAGVRLPQVDYVRPPTPPPDLDIEAWSSSIDLLKKLHPDVLYLAHFGPIHGVIPYLERLRAQIFAWGDIVLQALQEKKTESEIVQLLITKTKPELQRKGAKADLMKRYDLATNYEMTAQGYIRYWKKVHPDQV
ncbi:MBL fold metallo-hydrolase [Dictyobacter arantiisoli]|uniref:MBL fold metallo-hydrolase n=1 Tax=Dictyobacter arantiisoli TaxID=2014874 RepID=A0A5A5TBB0_9CHLR|nr:MBL fold metallo-hydrolase [Dictyobacter arantiisoli]GCF08204.1 MBL fold metallo-hydrolase [Dictyobacter arantiisoli]